jgi:cell division protease FtsH
MMNVLLAIAILFPFTRVSSLTTENMVGYKPYMQKLPYSSLIKKIDEHQVSKIYFNPSSTEVIAEIPEKSGSVYSDYSLTAISPSLVNSLTEESVKNNVEPVFIQVPPPNVFQQTSGQIVGFFDTYFFPFLILSFVLNIVRSLFITPGQGSMPPNPFGSMNNQNMLNKDKFVLEKANISLSSFAGSPEIFEECTEVVSYLKNATIYQNAGAEIPRGILLEGPPGTGKTLLAKAVASEADANFISIAASEFVEIFVGMGASKIRNLFKTARDNKPCIVFIDEIDAVGRQRGAGINMANDEREQTLNQLLAEMDGFGNNEGILIMAATNRKDVLDAALLRPGRFDRLITVSLPDRVSRKAILGVHSKNKILDSNINLDLVAEATTGFSGAQLKNLLNEAAIYAARNGNTMITEQNIFDALDKLIVGIVKKVDTRDEDSIRRVAIHETGHALLAATFSEYFDLKKVSIQSTYNGAGGFTVFSEYQNITESGLYTKDLLYKRLVVSLGGKAAESIMYGDNFVSVGAVQDLKQANSLAQRMVGNFGMGNELEVFYNENVDNERNPFVGRSFGGGDKYSDKTKEKFDEESLNLIVNAYLEAKNILQEKMEQMNKVIDHLLVNTVIQGKDVVEIMAF